MQDILEWILLHFLTPYEAVSLLLWLPAQDLEHVLVGLVRRGVLLGRRGFGLPVEGVEDVLGLLTIPLLLLLDGLLLECLEDVLGGVHLGGLVVALGPHCVEVVLLDLVHRLEGNIDLRDVQVLLVLKGLSVGLFCAWVLL